MALPVLSGEISSLVLNCLRTGMKLPLQTPAKEYFSQMGRKFRRPLVVVNFSLQWLYRTVTSPRMSYFFYYSLGVYCCCSIVWTGTMGFVCWMGGGYFYTFIYYFFISWGFGFYFVRAVVLPAEGFCWRVMGCFYFTIVGFGRSIFCWMTIGSDCFLTGVGVNIFFPVTWKFIICFSSYLYEVTNIKQNYKNESHVLFDPMTTSKIDYKQQQKRRNGKSPLPTEHRVEIGVTLD